MSMTPEEWLKQADYDMDTADIMHNNKRHYYAVFMCHLSIEKALKGLFQQKTSTLPPKGHNLISLLQKSGVVYDEKTGVFLTMLNEVDVKTRYPDNLDRLIEQYPEKNVAEVLNKAKEALEWIKAQF
ncbi:MAG: HEPN domain-containing protein [Candidatus Xenobiia bacterium LiM19]